MHFTNLLKLQLQLRERQIVLHMYLLVGPSLLPEMFMGFIWFRFWAFWLFVSMFRGSEVRSCWFLVFLFLLMIISVIKKKKKKKKKGKHVNNWF